MNEKCRRILVQSGIITVSLAFVLVCGSCGNDSDSDNVNDNVSDNVNNTEEGAVVTSRDIKTVMEAHVDELMRLPGVVAVAIGELEDKTPCITIYVLEKTAEITEKIPAEFEGHPVRFEISDEIKPMSGD